MKLRIVPIAIIVVLIAFFVIIDHKEFSCRNVQTVQSEGSETNKRLSVVSSSETKPVTAAEKADEAGNVGGKTENTPQQTHNQQLIRINGGGESAIDKPVESKAVSDEKFAPAAIPVVTAEEAEKLNEEATEYLKTEEKRREPFFRLYPNSKFETICFEGTIRATSSVPDPAKNDYDNCLYTLFVEIDSLLSEVTPENKISCEAIIVAPIMKDKTILQDNKFLPGDKVWCRCAEYDAMPQTIQEIQVSDDIQSYEHQQYYPTDIRKITAFSKSGNRNFSKRVITILPVQTLPKDEKAVVLRKKRIQNEIARIEEELKEHGGSFEKWKEEYRPVEKKNRDLSGEKFKIWIKDSYFAASMGMPTYKTQAYIDGILPYKRYLEENNIDLVIVRIPTRGEFAQCVLASEDFKDNPAWIKHYYECLKNDIEIIDPMPEMWEHRFDFPLFYFYNDSKELHPFEGQAFIAAKVLSEVLRRYSYSRSEQPIEIENFIFKTSQKRYFWPEGNDKYNPEENISFKRVIRDGYSLGSLAVNTGSPFVFLSNSFFAYPKRLEGASIPAYAAFFLQHVPDWFYQDGIGNPMLRNLIADHQALSNRKAVIMVGHPESWDGSFPPFPKYISDNAKTISQEKTLSFISSVIKILDDGSFVFLPDEESVTHFTQNPEKENANKTFCIELSVPSFEGKNTCILRINFGINSYLTTVVSDSETKEILDQTTLSPSTNQHADHYIPVSNAPRRIMIDFRPHSPNHSFSIKNIELWYY